MAGTTTITDERIRQLSREAMNEMDEERYIKYMKETIDCDLLRIYTGSMDSNPDEVRDVCDMFRGCDKDHERVKNIKKAFGPNANAILGCYGEKVTNAPVAGINKTANK